MDDTIGHSGLILFKNVLQCPPISKYCTHILIIDKETYDLTVSLELIIFKNEIQALVTLDMYNLLLI